jgi:hypothetical protein
VAVERQRPPALTAGLQVTGRHPRRNLQPELTPGLHAASPALMAGLCLTGRQGQFHPKSSKNYTSSAAALRALLLLLILPLMSKLWTRRTFVHCAPTAHAVTAARRAPPATVSHPQLFSHVFLQQEGRVKPYQG